MPVTIVILTLLLRVAYAFIAPSVDPIIGRDPLYGDASGYHILAVNLLETGGLTWDGETPTSFRMPGYPLFLAVVYAIAGPAPVAVRLAHAVLSAMTVIPVYFIGRRLGGKSVAAVAAVGVALHPFLLYMTGWVYSETLFFLLLWTGIWLFILALDHGSPRSAVLAGLTLGMATLVRPEIVVLPLCVAGLIWLLLRRPRPSIRAAIIAQTVLLAVVLPWTVRNVMVQRSPVLLTTNTGAVFYGGNNAHANGGFYLDVPFVLPDYAETASNTELIRRAVEWIRTNPDQYASLLPQKLYRFFAPTQMEHSGSPFGKWTPIIDLAYAGFLLLALYGGIIGRHRAGYAVIVMTALVVWYVFVALVLYGGTRVALPIAPALVLLAASGVTHLVSQFVRTRAPDEPLNIH